MVKLYVGIDQSRGGFGLSKLYVDGARSCDSTIVRKFDAKQLKVTPGVDVLKAIEYWLTISLRDDRLGIAHVAMEGYSYGSSNGREKAGELGYAVKGLLHDLIPGRARYPTIVTPNQVKLFTTGSGSADKKKMVKAVNERWGRAFTNDNAADAYALARIAEAIDTGNTNYPYEKSVLQELKLHTEAPPAA
ncbi:MULTISPECIES: hypothetical protein [Streptosporangium]|uniref:Holliday junction nuclease RuvC n=1 Tax=Streptosporangium brasiliense TaxID=47480 RepID=A0ABT9RPX5_9ACTN|nr:hypothetical protein [Streptosporangium brasiliense]MDP9870415.1 hypothetical protein [Streptosporangium brasiliense]